SETANENSQKALGQYNFVWSFGAMLGPLVGALLIFSVSIRTTFLITAGILLATLLVNLPKVRTSKNRLERKEINLVDGRGHNPKDLRQTLVRLISKNRVLITTNVVVAMSVSTLLTFFPPYANSIGVSILMIGVLTFSFTASRFITYLIVLRENVRRRIISIESRNRTALVAMGCASISGVFLAFRTFGSASYFLGFVLLGSSFAVVTTIIQVAMIVEAPPSQMGAGAGFVESAIGIGSFLGPVIAGLVSGGSFLVPFFVPLVIFLLVLPVLGLVPNS
ncbi:MAG: MFS transporter, partial [Nitrososphaerales archaeon]